MDPAFTQTFLRALRHPVRSRAWSVLQYRSASAGEIAKVLDEPVRTVAYHLRELEKEGVVTVQEERQRPRGPAERIYRKSLALVFTEDDWRRLDPLERDRISRAISQIILGDLVQALDSGSIDARVDRHLAWVDVNVDAEGWDELVALGNRFYEDVVAVRERCVEREAESDADGFVASVALGVYESPPPGRDAI